MLSNMSNDLKKIFLAGVGAVAITGEKSKELVDNLIEKGEITVAQGKVLNEELKRNFDKVKKDFENNNQKENKVDINVNKESEIKIDNCDVTIKNEEKIKEDIFNNLDKLSKEEIQMLKSKIIELQGEKIE